MSKELTSLEWLNYYKNKLQSSSQTFRPNGFDIVEKSLKALEIIREKRVNVEWLLETESVEEYNESLYIDLTQEEYDLLKEVLL